MGYTLFGFLFSCQLALLLLPKGLETSSFSTSTLLYYTLVASSSLSQAEQLVQNLKKSIKKLFIKKRKYSKTAETNNTQSVLANSMDDV